MGRALGVSDSTADIDGGTITGATLNNCSIGVTTPAAVKATTLTATGNVTLGDAATDVVSFHGATGTSQSTFVASNSINALSVSGVVGFTSSTSFSSLIGKVNSILQILSDHGLMAAS